MISQDEYLQMYFRSRCVFHIRCTREHTAIWRGVVTFPKSQCRVSSWKLIAMHCHSHRESILLCFGGISARYPRGKKRTLNEMSISLQLIYLCSFSVREICDVYRGIHRRYLRDTCCYLSQIKCKHWLILIALPITNNKVRGYEVWPAA